MSGNNIEITSKESIKPSSPTPHEYGSKHHKLSFIDQTQNPCYLPLIFFYGSEDSCSNICDHHSKISQHLKLSLADALTKFPHLAGRIKGDVSIDCNDSGALLVEARVHSPLSEALKNGPLHELGQYLPLEPYAAPAGASKDDNLPILAIQISFFECGGTAVGVCLSHKVADVASLMMFINFWAALSRGEKLDDLLPGPICDLASQLFPPLDESFPFFPKLHNLGRPMEDKLVTKRFLFDKAKLAALKEVASSSDFFGVQVKNPTRVEVVSAFIWKKLIEQTRAKGGAVSFFSTSQAVNLRARMKKILPSDRDVFGNLSIAAINLSADAWGFGNQYQELVWILRSAIKKINDDSFIKLVQSGIPYLHEKMKSAGVLPGVPPETVDRCHIRSWCRFSVYKVDYGWGKPLAVCTVAVPYKNVVILMDTRCDDGIEALITMPEDEMAMLPDELLSIEITAYF